MTLSKLTACRRAERFGEELHLGSLVDALRKYIVYVVLYRQI